MTDPQIKLPDSVETIALGEKTVYLIGTAHVSKESVEDVRATVAAANPDAICVELCQARYKSIVQRDNWKKMNLFKVIKERKTLFLLIQLIMTAFYKRLGKKLGVELGEYGFPQTSWKAGGYDLHDPARRIPGSCDLVAGGDHGLSSIEVRADDDVMHAVFIPY